MIKINRIENIDRIKVHTEPGWKDSFKKPITEEVSLPGVFFAGKFWQLSHPCSFCQIDIEASFKNNSLRQIGSLAIVYFSDRNFLKEMGEALMLKHCHYFDENNFEVFTYDLVLNFKGAARSFYYKCPSCSSKYLGAFSFLDGDSDRNPEPDQIYIERIVRVEFDENEFWEAYNK